MTSYNLYNIHDCLEAIKTVKKIPLTVDKKNGHYSKVEEIRKILIDLMKFNKYLFNPEYHLAFSDYKDKVEIFYKETTKADMDKALRYCIITICNELQKMIEAEEDTKNGTMIEVSPGIWEDAV